MDHCLTELNQGRTEAACYPGRALALTDRSGVRKRTKQMGRCVGGISTEGILLLKCKVLFDFAFFSFDVLFFNKHHYERATLKEQLEGRQLLLWENFSPTC